LTIERAIAALKTGRSVQVGESPPLTAVSVETATREMLALVDPKCSARLLLSGQRAAALSLANIREAADPSRPVLIERAPWLDGEVARMLADAGRDFDRPPLGPLKPLSLEQERQASALLALVRRSGLLPALWILQGNDGSAVAVAVETIEAAQPEVILISRAKLPLEDLPPAQIVAFRAGDDGQEHVALVMGAFGGRPPLVRLHSECLTGDVFGSLRCDCGPQLKQALRLIADNGGGVLLYLRQEGRGIGLANKLRAYALQDRGLDTVEANLRLGFADDERDYAHAAAMLRTIGIEEVRLLTNNPAKVEGLEKAGIRVAVRVGHQMPPNPHNIDYLATKRRKSGHLL
jgi:GTP cyclohydrolase II